MLFCRKHWAMVPAAQQAAVWATCRATKGREQRMRNAPYLTACAEAVEAVAAKLGVVGAENNVYRRIVKKLGEIAEARNRAATLDAGILAAEAPITCLRRDHAGVHPSPPRDLADPSRKRDLAAIHVAKKQLGMEDDTYRQMLWAIARVRSASDLDHAGRRRVLDHLKACGFKRTRPVANDPQSRKVRALWLGLKDLGALSDASEKALNAFLLRQTGAKALQWASSEQLSKAIESLKAWQRRARLGAPGDEERVDGRAETAA